MNADFDDLLSGVRWFLHGEVRSYADVGGGGIGDSSNRALRKNQIEIGVLLNHGDTWAAFFWRAGT